MTQLRGKSWPYATMREDQFANSSNEWDNGHDGIWYACASWTHVHLS